MATFACEGRVTINGPPEDTGEGGGGGGAVAGPGGSHSGAAGEGGVGNFPGVDIPVESSFRETGRQVACDFSIQAALAPDMPTVGRVSFLVDGLSSSINGGVIQFGLEEFTLEAPIDLNAPGFETLMLGMKASRHYSYRIGVSTGSEFCYSETQTILTEGLRAGVVGLKEVQLPGEVSPGFMVATQGPNAIILDQDGDVVWGYSLARAVGFTASCGGGTAIGNLFSAKLSYDGRYMLTRDLGPFDCGDGGTFFRIALDGSSVDVIELEGGDHHDFSVAPWGIAYIAKSEPGGYDKIFTAKTDGSDAKALVDLGPVVDVYPKSGGLGMEASHFNVIHYWRGRDYYTLSNREADSIAIVSGSGEILQGIGKSAVADFETILAEGTDAESGEQVWRVQHGHDLYAPNKLLVFSNGTFVSGQSNTLHYTIGDDNIAHLDWSYSGMGRSSTQGDVQMLHTGHVLLCASNSGLIQELDEALNVVASYQAPAGGFGYVTHRPTLYGAPPDGR